MTLPEILNSVSGPAICGGVFGLITWLLNRRAAKKDNTAESIKHIKHGSRISLYVAIKDRARQHIKEKCISSEDLEDITTMHEIYHDELGGNGFLDSVMDQVKHLPICENYNK